MKANEAPSDPLPRIRQRTLVIIAVCSVGALVGLFAFGFFVRHARVKKRDAMAQEVRDKPLVVQIVQPKTTQQSFELTLPADVRANASVALYARTNGYLASWSFDIGERVKKGDLMAAISAPDTDASLEEAEATLKQQETNRSLALDTEERFRGLVPTHGVTQQQLDQNHSASEQARAGVTSASAAVDRMKALVAFEKIVAPFDGVVTGRTYDVGALISASSIGPGQELFDLAEDEMLRVYVNVPQNYSPLVRPGQAVSLVLEQSFPGHRFSGTVARTTGTLDPVTRTLRTELTFKNDDPAGRIFPGTYGQAIFAIKRDRPILTVPTSALLFEAEGKEVAVVGEGDRIHFKKIALGSDYGTEIEILSGLKGDERVVANPGERLTEGIKVSPASESTADAQKQNQTTPVKGT